MDVTSSGSVSEWIADFKNGSGEAADKLWDRYFTKVKGLARLLLRDTSTRVADEEDVAASVFESLYKGAVAGKFTELGDRDDLWLLLLAITKQKVSSQRRYLRRIKRGGAVYVNGETELGTSQFPFDLKALVSDEPTPEFIAALKDQLDLLLMTLRDDSLRTVVQWRMERYKTREIAVKLGITTRAVERKLSLIRDAWTRVLTEYHRRDGEN